MQDLFLTETAELADVVLPGGDLGREDRARSPTPTAPSTSSEQAVDPPGEARADLDIFLDYARRMDFRDRDGEPLIKWDDPESRSRRGRRARADGPATTPALTLRQAARRQRHPVAVHRRRAGRNRAPLRRRALQHRPRLLRELRTRPGHRAPRHRGRSTGRKEPDGRAFLKPPHYEPPPEVADDEYPLLLTTGRTLYHFHTRTKTGRAPELDAAAPDALGRAQPADAGAPRHRRRRPRAHRVAARGGSRRPPGVSGIRPGVVFLPFHYGYWDGEPDRGRRARGQRADGHRLGPGVEATDLQDRPRSGVELGAPERACSPTTSGCSTGPGRPGRRLPRGRPRRTRTRPTFTPLRAARRPVRRATPRRCSRSSSATARSADDEPERLHSELFRGAREGGLGAAARPSGPLPDGLRVRHRLDAGRPGRAGRPRHDCSRSCSAARARPPCS